MGSSDDKQQAFQQIGGDREVSCSELSQRDIRSLIFHLLYAMDSFDYSVNLKSIVDNFKHGFHIVVDPEGEVFRKTASIIEQRDVLDEELKPLLSNWRLERLGCATRLILRLSLWELKYSGLSPSVVINEAVELAKCFAEIDAYKFINGVLDEWLKRNKPPSSDEVGTDSAS